MSDYRTLITTIVIKIPPKAAREGLQRLESQRLRAATRAGVMAFNKVMDSYGVVGEVTYTSEYSMVIQKFATKLNQIVRLKRTA